MTGQTVNIFSGTRLAAVVWRGQEERDLADRSHESTA
jgi:hypothetical protein